MAKESLVVNACIRWLWLNGCYVWRNNTGALRNAKGRAVRYGYLGSADIIGMTPGGQFIGVECKSDIGKLTNSQIEFGKRVAEHNGLYIVARSIDDLEAVRSVILAAPKYKQLPPGYAVGAADTRYTAKSTKSNLEEAMQGVDYS